jgi:glycosyltransferase involved in cell wall biosynthesis
VSLVSLRPELEGLAVPSKLYGILAAGTPVIFIGDTDGEVARVLRRGTCGLTVQNGAELAQRILELQGNEAIRCEMAKNARLIYEKEFARERALDKYERLICSLHANGSGTAA